MQRGVRGLFWRDACHVRPLFTLELTPQLTREGQVMPPPSAVDSIPSRSLIFGAEVGWREVGSADRCSRECQPLGRRRSGGFARENPAKGPERVEQRAGVRRRFRHLRAAAGRLASDLPARPPAASAHQGAGGNALDEDHGGLEIGLVAAVRSHAVHARRLRIEPAHRDLAANRARTSHRVLGATDQRSAPGRTAPAAAYDTTGLQPERGTDDRRRHEDAARVPADPTGRLLVTNRGRSAGRLAFTPDGS